MIYQYNFTLQPYSRGFHLITDKVIKEIKELPETGLLHLFIKHTSAGLTINENADPTVRIDFETVFTHLIPESANYIHNDEGPDDMPAHIKNTLCGSSITIPITNKKLNMGTWQGIYLCEFRNHASGRNLVITVYS